MAEDEEVVAIHPSIREAATSSHLLPQKWQQRMLPGRFSMKVCASAMLLATAGCAGCAFCFDNVFRVSVPVGTAQLTPTEIVDQKEAEIRGLLLKAKLRKLASQTDSATSNHAAGREVDAVDCQIDTAQSVFRIIRAANGIDDATKLCPSDGTFGGLTVQGQKDCAEAILRAIYSFTITTAMIAAAVSDCGHKLIKNAACASTVSAFVGNAEVVAGEGIEAEKACNLKDVPVDVQKINALAAHYTAAAQYLAANPGVKKLPTTLPPWAEPSYSPGQLSACFAQAGLGITFTEKIGVVIQDSLYHCAPQMQGDFYRRKACAVDMTGLIAALGLSTSFLAALGDTCKSIMGGHNFGAACAAGISGAIGAFSVVLSAGISLDAACGPSVSGQTLDPSQVSVVAQ